MSHDYNTVNTVILTPLSKDRRFLFLQIILNLDFGTWRSQPLGLRFPSDAFLLISPLAYNEIHCTCRTAGTKLPIHFSKSDREGLTISTASSLSCPLKLQILLGIVIKVMISTPNIGNPTKFVCPGNLFSTHCRFIV